MTEFVAKLKHMAGRVPRAPLWLAAVALLLWCSPALTAWCQWDRAEPWQLWRWLLGHFTHWSWDHLAWDLAVFVGLGIACARRSRSGWLACVLVSALAISGAVALWCPHLATYRGLSGIDCALFGWLVVELFGEAIANENRRRRWMVLSMVLAFSLKTAFELSNNGTVFVSNGTFVPVPLAHIVGFVTGILLSLARNVSLLLTFPIPSCVNRKVVDDERFARKLFPASRP
jgi:rhomboid family GlyGly-CTERM serine protease